MPLAQFQSVSADKAGTERLLASINRLASEPLKPDQIEQAVKEVRRARPH
jgi:hypothetical protein